jgi:hypothetical protein
LDPTIDEMMKGRRFMEPVPSWLNDAVAAAGIAGVYVEFDQMSAANDEQAGPEEAPPTH